MSASAQVGNLLNITADLNYYTMMLNEWSAKYEANSEKLQKQANYEEKHETAYESAIDTTRDLSISHGGESITIKAGQGNEVNATKYADIKVWQYDEALSLDLADKDIEFDTMKTMYEALVTQLQAEKDSVKQSAATALQDTHQLQS